MLKFYNKDIKTFGIDPILEKYRDEYKKINFKIPDFFSARKIIKITKKKFKIISALSVFYDAADPAKFIKDVKKILSNEGVFLLEFADLASIIQNKMFDTICHEHLEYYSTKVILNLCKKNNLKIFDIKKNSINGASKQYFICHEKSRYKNNEKIIKDIIYFENKLKLSDEKTYKNFIRDINKSKNKLYKFLLKQKK